jgi:4-amino-4-deoxy-L-arabinose transferase-like glycosyltransferase
MAQITRSESSDFNSKICLLALAVLCAMCFFVRLGVVPMIGPDEPRYTAIARAMYETGDWITPRLGGLHWFEKPALTYWLSAVGFQIFGVSEFAARLPIALFSSLGVFLLFWFGQRLFTTRLGYLSATALVSSALWVGFSRAATFDLPLAVAMEMALLAFFVWWREGKAAFWYLCCCGMGLAMLAKGLVGIVLPTAIIGLFLLLTRSLGQLLKRPQLLLVGAVIFLATSATWYAPMFLRHGQEFWQEFFVAHHFQRFLTNKYKHPQPFYFFTIIAVLGCLPWSFVFVTNFGATLKRWRTLWQEQPLSLFLWLWVSVIVGFFSLSTSKLTGYILPVFPAIALLIGGQLEQWWQRRPRTLWRWLSLLTCLFLIAVSVALTLRSGRISYADPLKILGLAAVLFLVATSCITLLLLLGERAATLALPFAVAISLSATTFAVMPTLMNTQSTAPLVNLARDTARSNERLVFFINNHFSIDFYAPELPLREPNAYLKTVMTTDEIAILLAAQPTKSLLVMTPQRWLQGIEDALPTERLGTQYTWALVRVTARNPPAQ